MISILLFFFGKENGIHLFLWIGLGANPEFIQKVFGVPSAIQIDIDRISLPNLENPLSQTIRNIIEEIRIQKHRCMRVRLPFIYLFFCWIINCCFCFLVDNCETTGEIGAGV